MTREILRDKTVDWLEKLLESPHLEYACCAVIAFAITYFGSRCIMILAR